MPNKIVLPKVRMVRMTPDPREVIALAGRLTYTNKNVDTLEENLTEEEIGKTITAILERKHLSCLRHVTFTFIVSGIGRACSHQMVRHAVGTAVEQRSQHYRLERDFNAIMPTNLDETEQAIYLEGIEHAQNIYDELLKRGVPRDEARQILPNGTETVLLWTLNLEAIYNFVKARACRVNTKEIMQVSILMRNIVIKQIPEMAKHLGPTCWVNGLCYEGPKFYSQCNRPWQTPTVLVTSEFPRIIELVGVGGRITQMSTAKRVGVQEPFEVTNYP